MSCCCQLGQEAEEIADLDDYSSRLGNILRSSYQCQQYAGPAEF